MHIDGGIGNGVEAELVVIINQGAGHIRPETQAQIVDLFRSHSVIARLLVARDGGEMVALAREAVQSNAGTVVGAGGDGTIDTIAAALAGTGKILGVLPLGTFNLLAGRLGIPLALPEAVRTCVDGAVMSINVGEVNGRTFLSRSGVGLYPLALRHREQMFRRFGRSRLIALLSGATALMRWGNIMTVCLTTETGKHLFSSRFVFVCNNPAELDYFHLPGRRCIEANQFAVYAPNALSPAAVLRLGFRMLRRKARPSRDFETFCSPSLSFEIEPSSVPVSLDGEVEIMQSPLHYRLRLGALHIRVPKVNSARLPDQKS